MPRSGIVPVIGGTGASSPTPYRRFDLVSAPDNEYFETFTQTDPVIGMRAVNSLEYAPHALPAAHSRPVNLLQHPNKFDETSAWSTTGGTVRQINERDWVYTDAASAALAQNFPWQNGTYLRWNIQLTPGDADPWVRLICLDGVGFVARTQVYFNRATAEVGTVNQDAASIIGGVDGISVTVEGDMVTVEWGTNFDAPPAVAQHWMASASGDGDGTRIPGKEILCREFQAAAAPAPFQDNSGVAALTNVFLTGDNGGQATLSLEYADGEFWYALNNPAAGSNAFVQMSGDAGVAAPHTMQCDAVVESGSAYIEFAGTGPAGDVKTAPFDGQMKLTAVPNTTPTRFQITCPPFSKVRWRNPDMAEGQRCFGLELRGYARHLLRRKQGIGGLWEPDGIQNKCQNYNVAPTDTSGLSFTNAVNEQIVQRGQIVGNLTQAHWDSVEAADPKGTLQSFVYFERASGFTSVIVTGDATNTNTHNCSFWCLGSGGANLGITAGTRPTIPIDGNFLRYSMKDAPTSPTEKWTVDLESDGDWIMFAANQFTEGDALRSLIPVGGANRVKSADRPTAPTDSVGVDRGRNSAPNSSSNGAVLGPLSGAGSLPTGWVFAESNGWSCEVTEIFDGGVTVHLTAANLTGGSHFALTTVPTIPAAEGEVWQAPLELSVTNLTNIDELLLLCSQSDNGTGVSAESALELVNVANDASRRYNVSRTMTAGAVNMISRLFIGGTGAADLFLTLKDWSSQHSSELLPHYETVGTPVSFAQWRDGFTIEDTWDIGAALVDNARFWTMYGDDAANERLDLRSSGGADVAEGVLAVVKGGSQSATIPTTSFIGEHLHSSRLQEGDNAYWMDGVQVDTLAASLPSDVHTIMIGNYPGLSLSRDGICKNIAFIGKRKVGAVDGFGAGFDEGFE